MGKKVLPKSEAAWAATPSAKPNGGTTVSEKPEIVSRDVRCLFLSQMSVGLKKIVSLQLGRI